MSIHLLCVYPLPPKPPLSSTTPLCPLPPTGKLICTLLGELLTFLFVRNTFQALTPLADAHTRPHESVLSSLNYSILDYLITLQPQASMFLTCTQEAREGWGCFSGAVAIFKQVQQRKCLERHTLCVATWRKSVFSLHLHVISETALGTVLWIDATWV